MTMNTAIRAWIDCVEATDGDIDTTLSRFVQPTPVTMGSGTGTGLADTKWSDTRTIAASAAETLDFNNLNDAYGRNVNFVKIKALHVRASAGNTNNVVIGNGATSPFQGPFDTATWTCTIPPGGEFLITAPPAGWSCANTVADKFKVTNSGAGTSVTYDIFAVGTSV